MWLSEKVIHTHKETVGIKNKTKPLIGSGEALMGPVKWRGASSPAHSGPQAWSSLHEGSLWPSHSLWIISSF